MKRINMWAEAKGRTLRIKTVISSGTVARMVGCLWLTPVILATQKAEIKRIMV
jgi:hypothetical protein